MKPWISFLFLYCLWSEQGMQPNLCTQNGRLKKQTMHWLLFETVFVVYEIKISEWSLMKTLKCTISTLQYSCLVLLFISFLLCPFPLTSALLLVSLGWRHTVQLSDGQNPAPCLILVTNMQTLQNEHCDSNCLIPNYDFSKSSSLCIFFSLLCCRHHTFSILL